MCTLSWKWSQETFHLYFNRDESRERPEALAPQVKLEGSLKILSPLDPQGGGSWLGVNEHGLCVALLNDYQGVLPTNVPEQARSRGLLVMETLQHQNLGQVEAMFVNLDATCYHGFLLHAFSRSGEGRQFHWNGTEMQALSVHDIRQPISSSSKYPLEARTYREERFQNDFTLVEQQQFHAFHDLENPALSPWMVREDAKTQSYTEIKIDKVAAKMWYGATPEVALNSPVYELSLHD